MKELESENLDFKQKIGYLEEQALQVYDKYEEVVKGLNHEREEKVNMIDKDRYETLLKENAKIKEMIVEKEREIDDLDNKV